MVKRKLKTFYVIDSSSGARVFKTKRLGDARAFLRGWRRHSVGHIN